jgi:hypothetical protein
MEDLFENVHTGRCIFKWKIPGGSIQYKMEPALNSRERSGLLFLSAFTDCASSRGESFAVRMAGVLPDLYGERRALIRCIEFAVGSLACPYSAVNLKISTLISRFQERIAPGTGMITYGYGKCMTLFIDIVQTVRDIALRYPGH